MKHIYLLFFVLISCSKTEPLTDTDGPDENPDVALKACFTLPGESIMAGETLEITNCSEGAANYSYDFGNGSQSSSSNPTVVYTEAGEYTITLTVTNAGEETKSLSIPIVVNAPESYYYYPEIPAGYSYIPLEVGMDVQNGRLFLMEVREDMVGPGGNKFYYREMDASFEVNEHYIADRPFNSGSAFVNILANGNKNFHFSRTLADLYGSQELTYSSTWGFISNINPANKHSYGFLQNGEQYLYYGTASEAGTYKAAIEHRNSAGDTFQIDLHGIGTASSMIGAMIATADGFVAFGGSFSKNTLAPYISNYKPFLAFFDTSLTLITVVEIENSVLHGYIETSNDLNGAYHLDQLSNGNLVAYGNGEVLVTNSAGSLIKRTHFTETGNIQGLVSLEDGFIISTHKYLRKFDLDGNQLKQLQYQGAYLPGFLDIDGKLFFAAGYESGDGVKLLYGAVDGNLNLLPLGGI